MKKLFTILFILLSLLSFAVTAQEPTLLWLKGIGGNQVDEVAPQVTSTLDGGFILLIGTTSDVGTGNIDSLCAITRERSIFIKYNSDASVMEWIKCYGNGGDSAFEYIFPTSDDGVVLGGEFNSDYGYGFLICKEDAVGNILWQKIYSGGNSALLSNIIATTDGGYIMVGDVYYTDTNFTVHNSGSMNADIGVLKVDSLGNKQWSKAIGGSEDDEVVKVISIPGGGYYVVGSTQSSDGDCSGYHAGGGDAYLVRLDSAGNIIWHNDLGGSGQDGIYGWAVADARGGVIMTNGSNSSDGDVSNNKGRYDYWVLDVDSSNNILWDNCFGGDEDELPHAICKAADGSIWVSGTSNTQNGEVDTAYGNTDAWIVHADSIGNFLDAKVLGSSGQDWGQMVYPLSNNAVITGGYYFDSNYSFSSLNFYGFTDAFMAIFSPLTASVKLLSNTIDAIELYPNPANEEVTIEAAQAGNYTIVITDVLGRLIYKANYVDKAKIVVSGWMDGIYYVQTISENGEQVTKRLIVK